MSEVLKSESPICWEVLIRYRPSANVKPFFTIDLANEYLQAISRKLMWVMSR